MRRNFSIPKSSPRSTIPSLAAARCRALGVGLLCGGYGASELQQATAFRVYEDPADLLIHIDELGGRR